MKLHIIDVRNRLLDSKLLQLDNDANIISAMLPRGNEPLPDSIKFVLKHYFIDSKLKDTSINITIEINEWIDKCQAVKQLQYMYALTKEFFVHEQRPTPPCILTTLESENFISIVPIYLV